MTELLIRSPRRLAPAPLTMLIALPEVLSPQFDRRAMRRAVGGVIPGIVIARQRRRVGDTLFRHQSLQGIEPVPVVGRAGVGIARFLCPLDLAGEGRGPF